MPRKTSAEHDPTLMERLVISLGWHAEDTVPGEDTVHAGQALIVRSTGERVSVGLVSADKLSGIGDLENEVVLDEIPDVNFENEIAQAVFKEEVMKSSNEGRGAIRSFLEDWIASAREDQAYIDRVLEKHKHVMEKHKETHAHAAEASRRAQEVLARYER